MSGETQDDLDPFVAAAREVLTLALKEMRDCIDGVAPDALNRRPAGDDTNSIAVLVNHSMQSTRSWLSVALGTELPPRDRPSEFRTTAPDAAALLRVIDELGADCEDLLRRAGEVDWGSMRRTHARPGSDASPPVTAAWALLHALEHLREHVGQMVLTRQGLGARG